MRFVVALRLALVSLVLLWATIHMHLHALVLAPPSTLLDSAPDDCSDDGVSPRATVASTMIDPMRDCRLCEERPRASAADESDAENERPCSLPLDALLRKVSSGEAEDISIDGDGAAMRVRSRRAGGRWCGGYELLAQVLVRHQRSLAANRESSTDPCELQRQLNLLAAEVGESLAPSTGSPGQPAGYHSLSRIS